MGMSIEDPNEAQQKFLDVIKADPDKGETWLKLLAAAASGFELIAAAVELGPEISQAMVKLVAAGVEQVIMENYPNDYKARSIELRTDTVQYVALRGLIPEGSRWDEKSHQIKTGEAS